MIRYVVCKVTHWLLKYVVTSFNMYMFCIIYCDYCCVCVNFWQELLEQKRQRHQRKAELGKRRSAASQNRMRIISQLGAEDIQVKKRSKKTKEDTFGMNDEDWNVYRDIVSQLCLCMVVFTDSYGLLLYRRNFGSLLRRENLIECGILAHIACAPYVQIIICMSI